MSLSGKKNPRPFPWIVWVLKNIARVIGVYEDSAVKSTPNEPESCIEPEMFPTFSFVFSDTDNDISSVENTLRFAGVLNGKGELAENLRGISIIHTGDFIDKKDPDISVVEYWQSFQKAALVKGCRLRLIVGNHEQQIWQNIRAGEQYGKAVDQTQKLKNFVESLDLFYVAGSVLFIHGYPTLEFLQALLHFKEVTGKDLNCFNTDHYRKAFKSINSLRQYSYVRENRRANYLLYDVTDASRYYRKKGLMVGSVLEQLKIGVVIHGHRPQRAGVQVDYEFSQWIPNIRMIGNDTMVKRRGIGATVIRETTKSNFDMFFINKKTESGELLRKIQDYPREPGISSDADRMADPKTADTM